MNFVKNIKGSGEAYSEFQETLATLQSNINDLSSIDVKGERTILEKTIEDLEKGSTNYLSRLKRCLNALTPINQLPEELLSFIIRLSASPTMSRLYPYLSYTWVCHHWRSVLINNAEFWTLIRHKNASSEFVRELVVRSKSAKLDVIIRPSSSPFDLIDFFTTEGSRVRRLALPNDGNVYKLDLKNIRFSSLRKVILYQPYPYKGSPDLHNFLPVLVASEGLETFECGLSEDVSLDQALTIFRRVLRLSVDIHSVTLVQSFLSLLHKCPKLQTLNVTSLRPGSSTDNKSELVHLPELKMLSTNIPFITNQIRSPCLSNLFCVSPRFSVHHPSILDSFGFSSMKYLYLRCSRSRPYEDHPHPYNNGDHCVLGSKERMRCRHFHMKDHAAAVFEDFLPPNHNSFHISLRNLPNEFGSSDLQAVLSIVLPQIINLVELRVLIPHQEVNIQAILSMAPSLQILIIKRGDKLLNFIKLLSDPSLCPELNELSYSTYKTPRNLERYALDVGKKLIKCLQLRKKSLVHQLQSIILRNCPPLPDNCLEELQKLETTVITAISEHHQMERANSSITFSDQESY